MASIPTIKIYKGNESRNINEADLPKWKKDGWSTEAKGAPAPKPAPKPVVGKDKEKVK